MRMLLRFGDNDFSHTFRGVFLTIGSAIAENNNLLSLTKKQWAEIINNLSLGSYQLWQDLFRHDNTEDKKAQTKRYLTIDPKNLYLDEEMDLLLKAEKNMQNGAWVVLDTELWFYSDGREGVYIL